MEEEFKVSLLKMIGKQVSRKWYPHADFDGDESQERTAFHKLPKNTNAWHIFLHVFEWCNDVAVLSPPTFPATKPQMVPTGLGIGFQGLALIQGQIYNPSIQKPWVGSYH